MWHSTEPVFKPPRHCFNVCSVNYDSSILEYYCVFVGILVCMVSDGFVHGANNKSAILDNMPVVDVA